MMHKTMWKFKTKNFTVRAVIETDKYVDTSFDETGKTQEKINSGEWLAFNTIVSVEYRGATIGTDTLCGSIYETPSLFFVDHRDSDTMNRNCSLMRQAKGQNVSVCHYFPEMVRQAIAQARNTFTDMPRIRAA